MTSQLPDSSKTPDPFALASFVRRVRLAVRASDRAELSRKQRAVRTSYRLGQYIPAAFRNSSALRNASQLGKRVRNSAAARSERALQVVAARLYNQRRQIKALMTKVVNGRSTNEDWTRARRVLATAQNIIDRQIPLVSGRVLELLNFTMVTMLTAQMTAGNHNNTLMLARLLNLSFRPHIKDKRFPTAFVYFQALLHTRQYERIAREFDYGDKIDNHYLAHIVGVAFLYTNRPRTALYFLERANALNGGSHSDHRMLGRAHLLLGNLAEAASWFKHGISLAPSTVMAHQNYAGRYDVQNYKPKDWELRRAGALMIYDNFGQLAEDFFLLGDFDTSFRCYQQMLDFQRRWKRQHPLPAKLRAEFEVRYDLFDPAKPIRILPYEWVTQFGHIALLDSYLKMARLGMYPDAHYVVLAPKDKVVNEQYLTYWEKHFIVVRDEDLVNELFPYQRLVGDNFMAYPGADGLAEPWTRAAARAHIRWAEEKREPLLSVGDESRKAGEKALAKLGVPEGAWYVGLHVREGGYYGEGSGSISTHRNSRIEDYMPAVREIVRRGGYVIRLGDKSMRPLPPMDGVIDYAHSKYKSPDVDIFFCATSRFVIGTTSGLTTACLSFGTPMVLVNAISNDWQLWSDDTDFVVKTVRDIHSKQIVPFSKVFAMPMQGYLINSQVMRRNGLEALANSAEDITEAVRYKLDILDGILTREEIDAHPLMQRYRQEMQANSPMFGAARPVIPFLERHPEVFADSPLAAPDNGAPTDRPGLSTTAHAGTVH